VDTVAFRPAPSPASGVWTADDGSKLTAALTAAFGTAPPVLLDGLSGSPDEDAHALASAQCSPGLAGAVVDRVADSTTPDTPADGIFTASGAAKAGWKTLAAAIARAQKGDALCPGMASPAAAAEVDYPTSLPRAGSASLDLACVRDCLYLVTLDRSNGRPVAARRGALTGGAPATTVALPKVALAPSTYRLDVRLVSEVNPGDVVRMQSPPLSVG
jgi:hypothetical protein